MDLTEHSSLYRFQGSQARTLTTAQSKTERGKQYFDRCLDAVLQGIWTRLSEQEHRVDAMALIAEEGRGKLRKAWGSRKQA